MSPDKPTAESAQIILTQQLQRVQEDLDLLVKSGNWLVWSCDVRGPRRPGEGWSWDFRDDFCKFLPPWFDIERQGDENFAVTLNRARFFEDIATCDETSQKALTSDALGYSQTFRVRLRDGSISWIEENVAIQPRPDGSWHLVGICIDATDRKLTEERLLNLQEELVLQNRELALREMLQANKLAKLATADSHESLTALDALTGMKNRTAFHEHLEKEWQTAVRYASPMSVVLVDIDNMKGHNDKFGREYGDRVLKVAAHILQETARDTDFIARYGGDEFAIILPRSDGDGATALAERFRANVEKTRWEHGKVTASFGVATVGLSVPGPQSLVEAAARALHTAKQSGRNRVGIA